MRERCAERQRAAAPVPVRTTARTRRPGRRKCRIRAAEDTSTSSQHPGGADVVAADRLRDRRKQAAPLGSRLVHDRDEVGTLIPGTPSRVPRKSAAKVPMPQARGGYVETIVVRIRVTFTSSRDSTQETLRCAAALAAHRGPMFLVQSSLGRRAQPVEDSPQALSHHVLPLVTPRNGKRGLVWESRTRGRSRHRSAPAFQETANDRRRAPFAAPARGRHAGRPLQRTPERFGLTSSRPCHPCHPCRPPCRRPSRWLGDDRLGHQDALRDRGGVLKCRAGDHRRVDDARLDGSRARPCRRSTLGPWRPSGPG